MVKGRRERRAKTCLDRAAHWCCGGCTFVLCILYSSPFSSTSMSPASTALHCSNAPHCHAPCSCAVCVLSVTLSLPSHAHTRTHTATWILRALFVSLLLLLVVLLSSWCAQPSEQRHWGRRGSGDCRGAEEQQHAADAGVSAVCVDLGWWMRLCLW